MRSVRNKIPRYDDGACTFESSCNLEIFQFTGRCMSRQGCRDLTNEEYKAAYLYILTNISEMGDFFEYVFNLKKVIFHKFSLSMLTNLFSSFRKFDIEQWKSRITPTENQLRELRLHGWKSGRGAIHGPNFFDWFKTKVMLLNT